MLTVSLIEDDEDYRQLLSRSIRLCKNVRLLGVYQNADEALAQLPHVQPDVALVDIKLPGMDGIECIRQFHSIVPAIKTLFLILTGYEDENLIFDALKAGADGYLLKGRTSSKEMLEAIKEVFAGGAPMTRGVARKVIKSFGRRPNELNSLTEREQDLLRHLAEDLTYKEIADELSISIATVRTHLTSIYHKLHVHSRVGALQYIPHSPKIQPSQHAKH